MKCAAGQTCLSSGGCAKQDDGCDSGFRYDAVPRIEVAETVLFGECTPPKDLVRSDGVRFCNGSWVNYDTRANCGACGKACAATETCVSGSCSLCSATICGETCADLKTNGAHCGACGNGCPGGSTCTAGACVCGAGKTLCGSACKDLQNWNRADTQTYMSFTTDPCGSCTTFCKWGEYCQSGKCIACSALGAGWQGCTYTGSTWLCANTQSSNAYCGRCDWHCNTAYGYVCRSGVCSK